jgi:hypothetical protein
MADEPTEPADGNHLREFVAHVVAGTRALIENDKVHTLRFLTSSARQFVLLVDRLVPAIESAEADLWAVIGPEQGYGPDDVSAPELVRLRTELLTLAEKVDSLIAARHARAV